MAGRDWSREEVEATVADYLDMFRSEMAGVPYSKAEHRRRLGKLLNNRSEPSIEYKHANISAAMIDLGCGYISGYKPRHNYQRLLYEVLSELVFGDEKLLAVVEADVRKPGEVPTVDDILSILTEPPKRKRAHGTVRERPVTPRGPVNYLEMEARNRSLGAAGEEFVLRFEQARLLAAGQDRLAGRIEHVAQTRGDGDGFDILSFEPSGAERLIEVKTTKMPNAEMIGAAIGIKVVEDVLYITGMDRFISGINEETMGYLKDLGAATASNGAVGLYHMAGVTPEAVKKGRDLLNERHQTYVIDDAELDRLYKSYPDLWKDKHGDPQRVFLGCPHMTYGQMTEWGKRIVDAMEKAGNSKVGVPTFMFGSQYVKDAFEKRNPELAKKLEEIGVAIPINCPMMWCSTPVQMNERVATNSNKTRVYTTARFFFDDALTELIVTGKLPAAVA